MKKINEFSVPNVGSFNIKMNTCGENKEKYCDYAIDCNSSGLHCSDCLFDHYIVSGKVIAVEKSKTAFNEWHEKRLAKAKK